MIHLDLYLLRGCTMRATALLLGLAFFAVLIAGAGVSEGAVISRDWKTPGDGLLTYDTVNNREWLDLPYLIAAYPVVSRSPETRLQLILPELEPGGLLDGFVVANSADVAGLATSAGIDVNTMDLIRNKTPTSHLLDLIDRTASGNVTYGLLNDFSGTPDGDSRLIALIEITGGGAGLRLFPSAENTHDIPSLITSVMVYRSVPEPSPLALLFASSAFFLILRLRLAQRCPACNF